MITERVERGAALLDGKRPEWWRVIDLNRLDVSDTYDCICGQLSLDAGDPFGTPATAHGFGAEGDPSLPIAEDMREVAEEFAALTAAWRDLIGVRRQGAGVPA